jgi:acyl carrier protein
MTLTRVTEIITGIIAPFNPPDAQTELKGDLHFDGYDRMQIAEQLREEFGVECTDAQIEGWTTVGSVVASVECK